MPRSAFPADAPRAAFILILALTAWRWAALGFDRTDLFVDEAQYWLWGQKLDWGYFSKPPMIAWLSRAVTGVAGSDAVFWVRAPGAVLHAATAGLVGLTAARLAGSRTGAWAAAVYATAPFATFGSWQFSTDTVMLPFYAAALYALVRLTEARSAGWAAALGIAIGLGTLSKYAMLYLPTTALLAAALVPAARIAWRDAAVAAAVALAVASPNLIWNLAHGGQTFRHLAEDNARLGRTEVNPGRAAEFLLSQFGVFGPVVFALLLAALWRAVRTRSTSLETRLLCLSVPVIGLMTAQALRAPAFANWAVTAYVAGSVLAALQMPRLPAWLRQGSLALHLAFAVAFPLVYVFPFALEDRAGLPVADRYMGHAALSRKIAETAAAAGLSTVVAADRTVLAALFYTLRNEDVRIATPPAPGRPHNYYEQTFALPPDFAEPVLFADLSARPPCSDAVPLAVIRPEYGSFLKAPATLYRIAPGCLPGARR